MNIIVLVKQVPDTESLLEVDTAAARVDTRNVKWIINPYDEFAIEEALRIKEQKGEGSVTVISAGPKRSEAALRTALAMGADKAVLVDDEALEGSDPLGTARVLASAIGDQSFDLILAGMRAVDDDSYQVPSAVAEYLDIGQINCVVKQEINDGKITCEQAVEGGILLVEGDLPILLTAQKGINEPRYASLPNIMKAKKKPLATRSLADIGLPADQVGPAAAKIATARLSRPPERKAGKLVEGESAAAKAVELVKLLKEEAEVL